jgi:hypothetical protein
MFIPDPGSVFLSIPDPDPGSKKHRIPDPEHYKILSDFLENVNRFDPFSIFELLG